MVKIQNLKRFEHWNLEFICYLGIVIWCFRTWSLEFFELTGRTLQVVLKRLCI
jgi:hypothetical protein